MKGVKYTKVVSRPCEWVLPGHPDRLADAFVARLARAQESYLKRGHCALEVAVHRDRLYLTGRFCKPGGKWEPNVGRIAAEVWVEAGYRHGGPWGPSPKEIKVEGNACFDKLHDGEAQTRCFSDDQCIVTGYAIDLPGTQFMPPEHWFARNLALSLFRETESELALCPDGKVLIELEEIEQNQAIAYRLKSVSASLLAKPDVGELTLRLALIRHIRATVNKAHEAFGLSLSLPDPEKILLNGSGNFHIGGPEGDNGLSGKKLLLDYYGPRVPMGGGAIWGKDHNKPDRSGALIAREVALSTVHKGLACEATVTCLIEPGSDKVQIVRIQTPQGELHPDCWPGDVDLRLDPLARTAYFQLPESTHPVAWGQHYPLLKKERSPAFNYLKLERLGVEVSWGEGVRERLMEQLNAEAKSLHF